MDARDVVNAETAVVLVSEAAGGEPAEAFINADDLGTALDQDNTMFVVASPALAQYAYAKFEAHWAWTLAHEQTYQLA